MAHLADRPQHPKSTSHPQNEQAVGSESLPTGCDITMAQVLKLNQAQGAEETFSLAVLLVFLEEFLQPLVDSEKSTYTEGLSRTERRERRNSL